MKTSGHLNSAGMVAIGLLLALAVPGSPLGPDKIRTDLVMCSKMVMLTASVKDDGRAVTNLRHTDFKVFDKDTPQEIAFWSREDRPASVAIVIDTSISATRQGSTWLAAIRQEILSFKDRSNELNEYSVISADLSPQLVADWTSDEHYLIEELSKPAVTLPKARTSVFDACQLALHMIKERSNQKKAVLLISDGRDTASKLSYTDLYDSMLRSDALIYLICPSDANTSVASDGSKALTKLAFDSGASAFFPSSYDQVKNALGTLADAIRDLYVIGYYPPGRRDGSWHPVRITVSLPSEKSPDASELVVRTRLGYYALSQTR